jgi:dihydrofolate reductase
MVPYWPDVAKNPGDAKAIDVEFARAFDAVSQIVVFSNLLNSAAKGSKTKIANTNLRDEVIRLKQEPGKNISTVGVDIPTQLAALGLIDEYHFVVHPIIAGQGRKLFDGINLQAQLKLVGSTPFKSGAIALRYVKR